MRAFNSPEGKICTISECTSNDGGCIKRWNSGDTPPGFSTSKCPGFVRRPLPNTDLRASSIGVEKVRRPKVKKHRDGTQFELEVFE